MTFLDFSGVLNVFYFILYTKVHRKR